MDLLKVVSLEHYKDMQKVDGYMVLSLVILLVLMEMDLILSVMDLNM